MPSSTGKPLSDYTQGKPLSDKTLRSIRSALPWTGQEECADGLTPGLLLRVSKNRMSWVLRYRNGGKMPRLILGIYEGNGRGIGLKEARDRASSAQTKIRNGGDPVAELKALRLTNAARIHAPTLDKLIQRYEEEEAPSRGQNGQGAKTWKTGEAQRRIRHVFAPLLTTPLPDLTGPQLQNAVDDHSSRFSAGAAVRYIKPVLKWGAKKGLLSMESALWIDQPKNTHTPRERVLSRDEIRAILANTSSIGMWGNVIQMLFWTACRLNEICHAKWSDIKQEGDRWTLHITNTKQGRPHSIPLPSQARDALKQRQLTYAPDPDTLLFPNAKGNVLGNWDRMTKRLQQESATTGWHRHDIRRTVATLMGELGTPRDVVEIALGHALSSAFGAMSATYNKSRDVERHRSALQLLADTIGI
ncbi:tyrosine-type recombinase/integrase [Saccharibacter sp. 17.LH.SD]|uniref:tyrosine-type recombinase/integrase n=1 Tax=Saccharibacter sp. 17.LH.SD TaxID=2689393 RepID=UPI001368BDF3|nr:tyrosine-type recombinase/integrase [Saccharibacter sp. 17.LH.SD]MXV44698.1 tyrosine-type recombinase/integrase [Saccharibacter sp. 17.LH.SD]